jgi:hypothetical protein
MLEVGKILLPELIAERQNGELLLDGLLVCAVNTTSVALHAALGFQ